MTELLLAALWLLSLAPGRAAVHQDEVAPHLRALEFPRSPVRLPAATDRRFVLESGPVVYLAEDHALPLVEITLALPAGGFLDPPGQVGLAYLTASLLRRGGGAGLDADNFDERLDELGARMDSLAGHLRAGATLSVPSWSFAEALRLFVGMLARPAFQEDRLRSARSNLHESLGRRNESALAVLQREWDWLMVGREHFSARAVTTASLDAIRREDLLAFHHRVWRPAEMILAVSGDFQSAELLVELQSLFADWPARPPRHSPIPWPPPPPAAPAPAGLYHYESNVPQAKVMLGQRLPKLLDWRHPDRFALEVLAEILGGSGAISRVAGRLRTAEGLAYRASAEIDPGEFWPGELRVFFETESTSVARAVELALQEIASLGTGLVHPKELDVAVQTLLAELRLDFDTAEEIAGSFAEDELLGRPHGFWQEYLEAVAAVNRQDLARVAREYLRPGELVVLVVGRWAEIASGRTGRGRSLESVIGAPVHPLPARDPATLQPLAIRPRPLPGPPPDPQTSAAPRRASRL